MTAESAAEPARKQNPRFLPAAKSFRTPTSAESAASAPAREQKPRFLLTANSVPTPNSAESAAGAFQPN